VRLVALAAALLALGSTTTAAPKVAYREGPDVFVNGRLVARHAAGAVRWSGDGKLLSVGGRVVGGPTVSDNGPLAWAPAGETAAFVTKGGGVVVWTPSGGRRRILPGGWGASSLAWGPGGRLAVARYVCHVPCGLPSHEEVWIWQAGTLRRVAGPLNAPILPIVAGLDSRGRALWWQDGEASASIAADGLELYANRSRVVKTLVYPDYVAVCGSHLALVVGRDRYAMHGKRILFDGRDASRDRSRSWVSPSCTSDGRLVASASRNLVPRRIGNEHRAIWQLLPTRRQLTHPPKGRTDEDPHLLPDGSVVFVRTRSVSKPLELFGVGTVELLRGGRLTAIGSAGKADNFYGHYAWPDVVAIAG
jgi:hypothetical protein